MRINEPVIYTLIIGILIFTVATEQIWSREESFSADTFHLRLQQYLEGRMRRECNKNSGPTPYDDLKYKIISIKVVNCVQSLVDVTQFEADLADARPHNEEGFVIDKYCRRVPTFERCVKNMVDSMAPCQESEGRVITANIIYQTTKSLLKFFCNDGKQKLVDFIAAGGTECVASKYPAVRECFTWASRAPKLAAVATPGVVDSLLEVGPQVSGCTNMGKYRRCSTKVLEQCVNSTVAQVVDVLFNLVHRNTFCTISLHNHPPQRGSSSNIVQCATNENGTYKSEVGRSSPTKRSLIDRFLFCTLFMVLARKRGQWKKQ